MARKVPTTIHAISSLKRQGYAQTIREAIDNNKKLIELNKINLKKLEKELNDLEEMLSDIETERKHLSKEKIHVFDDETENFWKEYWLKRAV